LADAEKQIAEGEKEIADAEKQIADLEQQLALRRLNPTDFQNFIDDSQVLEARSRRLL